MQRSRSLHTNLSMKSSDIDQRVLKSCNQLTGEVNDENTVKPDKYKCDKDNCESSDGKEKSTHEEDEPEEDGKSKEGCVKFEGIKLSSDSDDHNRTMVLQVDRTDLRLISPDRKEILLHKHHKDVTTCIQVIFIVIFKEKLIFSVRLVSSSYMYNILNLLHKKEQNKITNN